MIRAAAAAIGLVLCAGATVAQTTSSVAVAGGVRAQLVAGATATLAAELDARITDLKLREGETFKQGQTLVAFDCRRQQAELGKARALAEGARSQHAVTEQLVRLNSANELELARYAAELAAARAEIAIKSVVVDRCRIVAPFDGRVVEREARQHEFVSAGEPLLTVYDAADLEAELIVPSAWLAWIRAGTRFTLTLDETGREYAAEVARLGASVDAVSQSIKLFARISAGDGALLPGMSGLARFSPP